MNDKVLVDFTSKITPVKPINDQMTLCKCYIMAIGENRNKSNISKEAVDNALPSIYNIPIVGHLFVDDDNETRMGGHDKTIEKGEDGKYRFKTLTVPFGVVPQQDGIHYETVTEKDGKENEYLVGDIILWTGRYPELLEAKYSDGTYFNQSMEILPSDTNKSKGITYINAFQFSALCLLGKSDDSDKNVEPCFESARVEPYDFSAEWTKLFGEFKDELAKCYQMQDSEEGGKEALDIETVKTIMTEMGYPEDAEIPFELTEDMDEESIRAKLAEAYSESHNEDDGEVPSENGDPVPADCDEDKLDDDGEPTPTLDGEDVKTDEIDAQLDNVDDEVGDSKKLFDINPETSEAFNKHLTIVEIYKALEKAFAELSIWDEDQYVYYSFIDADDKYAYVHCWMRNSAGESVDAFQKIAYSISDYDSLAVVLDMASAVEVRQVWLTREEEKALEEKENEFQALVDYKAARLEDDRKKAYGDVLDKFSDLSANEEFQKLSAIALTIESVDALEEKCYAIRGKNAVKVKKPLSEIRVPVRFGLDEEENTNNRTASKKEINKFIAAHSNK